MTIAEVQDGVRREVLATLLEKIDADRFPSTTMMDMVEQLVGPEELGLYAEVLLRKVRDDTYPSMDLIKRLVGLG